MRILGFVVLFPATDFVDEVTNASILLNLNCFQINALRGVGGNGSVCASLRVECQRGFSLTIENKNMKQVHSVAPGRHLLALVGLAIAATVGSLPAADKYYVNDHLATTTAVTDAAGEIAAIEADAFGTPVAGATQAARYTGKPYDNDIGAYVFPCRNYRSDEARWMSADPSGFPDGLNAAKYAPSPFREIDALGLAVFSISAVFTSPVDGSTYTYNLTDPAPLNLNLPHSVDIQVTGVRTENESTKFTLKRALYVDGTRRTNEALDLEFGNQTARTWTMNITNFSIFFSPNLSTNGAHTSTIYTQAYLGQEAVSSPGKSQISYNIVVVPHKE